MCQHHTLIGPATLFKTAAQAGWAHAAKKSRATPETFRVTPRERPPKAPARPLEAANAQRPGMGAADLWASVPAAPATHGYNLKKDGRPDGLRVVPDDYRLRANGEDLAGCLVVQVVPLDGAEPVSLQFIATPETGARRKAKGKTDKPN